MSDESSVSPGQSLHLKLLVRPINDLHGVARPGATGCAVRARTCERCGVTFDIKCFWAYVANADEWRRWIDEEDQMSDDAFICQGCRN